MSQLSPHFKYSNRVEVHPCNQRSFLRIASCGLRRSKGYRPFENYLQKISSEKELTSQKIQVVEINPEVGQGVFSTQSVKKGEIISHYAGIFCSDILAYKSSDNRYLFGFDKSDSPRYHRWLVDAQKQGNVSRFFNHSKEGNLEVKIVNVTHPEHDRVMPFIFFVSQRDIHPGEQLCYDYGDLYWDALGIQPRLL